MLDFFLSPIALWLGCSIPVLLLLILIIVVIVKG